MTGKTLDEFLGKYMSFIKPLWNICKGNKKLIVYVIAYRPKNSRLSLGDTVPSP